MPLSLVLVPVTWLPAVFCSLFMDLQNSRGCIITRGRIGLEIIYSTACLLVDMA